MSTEQITLEKLTLEKMTLDKLTLEKIRLLTMCNHRTDNGHGKISKCFAQK